VNHAPWPWGTELILYHRTNPEAAEAILREGFRDATGQYLTDQHWSGVWLSDVPLDVNVNLQGDVLLKVNLGIPSHELRQKYEWQEEGKPYREFLIPAEVVNSYAKKVELGDESAIVLKKKRRRTARA